MLVWSDLVGSGAVLSDLVWSVQLDVTELVREGGSYRGDTKTMTLSEDKGHGKNKFPTDLHMKAYHLNHWLLSLHELKYLHYSVTLSSRGWN